MTSKYTNLISLIMNSVLGDYFIDYVITRNISVGDGGDGKGTEYTTTPEKINDYHITTKSLANTYTTTKVGKISTNFLVKEIYQRFFLNLDNIFFVLSKFLTFSSMYMVSTNLIHHYHSHFSKILKLYQPSKIYLFFSTDCMNKSYSNF